MTTKASFGKEMDDLELVNRMKAIRNMCVIRAYDILSNSNSLSVDASRVLDYLIANAVRTSAMIGELEKPEWDQY